MKFQVDDDELVEPKLPLSLREAKGDLTSEQSEEYNTFRADRDRYRVQQLLIEICRQEEKLFPLANFNFWTEKIFGDQSNSLLFQSVRRLKILRSNWYISTEIFCQRRIHIARR